MENPSHSFKELNVTVFKFFNETFGKPDYEPVMILADMVAGHHFFQYHLILVLLLASVIIYSKKHNIAIVKELAISWVSAICTLLISLVVGWVIINLIKYYTGVNRPYCTLENIYKVPYIVDAVACNMSFPSGHIAFTTTFIASFWPLMNRFFKIFSLISIVVIAITRMASGAHYPMDLVGAVVICLPLTLYLRDRISSTIRHYKSYTHIVRNWFKKTTNS